MFANPMSGLVAVAEEAIQPGDLGDEIVEAAVGGGELAERPDEEAARARSPQEQRKMRQVPALRECAREVGQGFNTLEEVRINLRIAAF